MARHLEHNLYGTAELRPENALSVRPAQPAKTTYSWKEVFGDAEDESPGSVQTCEGDLTRFQMPEVDADEFESVYLWFLA